MNINMNSTRKFTIHIYIYSYSYLKACLKWRRGLFQRYSHNIDHKNLQFGFCEIILVVKPRILRKVNLITVLTKNSMDRRQGWDFKFQCERKTPENYSKENPRNQAGTENPIHIMPPVGFEPGSQRWEASQDTTRPT